MQKDLKQTIQGPPTAPREVDLTPPCDRTDMPERGNMICGGCGRVARKHAAWRGER